MRTVIVVNQGEIIKKEIGDNLVDLQKEVEGLIDIPYFGEDLESKKINIVINDEGKINMLNPSIVVMDKSGHRMLDVIAGNAIFIGYNEEGDSISLDDKQCDYIEEILSDKTKLAGEDGIYPVRILRI